MINLPAKIELPVVIDGNFKKGGTIIAAISVEFQRCWLCDKPIIPQYVYWFVGQMQVSTLGLVKEGFQDDNGHRCCIECKQNGKHTFECALCHELRQFSEVQYEVGDPREYLCKICYNTQSAKVWEEKKTELYESHRWDNN